MNSSTPPVQAVAQLQAIGTRFLLAQQVLVEHTTPQSPSIPTMLSTFHTMILTPIMISSMLPVQAGAQQQAIGTMSPLTHQVLWDNMPRLPSIPMMSSTYPTLMIQMMISSMQHVQAVVQPQAIGTTYPLTQQVWWDHIRPSLLIPTMLSYFLLR